MHEGSGLTNGSLPPSIDVGIVQISFVSLNLDENP